jgi:hypothetical protein
MFLDNLNQISRYEVKRLLRIIIAFHEPLRPNSRNSQNSALVSFSPWCFIRSGVYFSCSPDDCTFTSPDSEKFFLRS